VAARNPQNIGAAARAMHDFGFSDLRIVNDYAAPFEAAQLEAKSAVAAESVMTGARRFDALADALADCTLVIATTAIGAREITQTVLPLQQIAPQILAHLASGETARLGTPKATAAMWPGEDSYVEHESRAAILFGSEKTGLTNDQLSHASVLTTIPMFQPEGQRHLSMNLGQSVAVCLYELTREGLEGAREIPTLHEAAATAADRERLTQYLREVLEVTGYVRRFPGNSTEPVLRQLAQQLGVSHREAMTWMGVLRQILWRQNAPQDDPSQQ
jgi:tRNA/rRNA methyltransferase